MASRRSFASAVVTLAIALTASGADVSAKAKTQVTYMNWTTCAEDVLAMKRLAASFNRKHPDIEVKLMNTPWSGEVGYLSKLLTMTMAGLAPDVMKIPSPVFPKVAQAGLLLDLQPYVAANPDASTENWTKGSIEACRWQGKLVALPEHSPSWWVTYNPKLFALAGIQDPSVLVKAGDWSLDTMAEASLKLTKFDSQGKLTQCGVFQMSVVEAILPYVRAFGGDFLNADGTKCLMDSEPVVKGLDYVFEQTFKKQSTVLAGITGSWDLSTAAKQSKFGMAAWWNTVVSYFTSAKVTWAMNYVPFPRGPVASDNIVSEVEAIGISRSSKRRDAAWEFLKYAAGEPGQSIIVEDLNWPPTRKSVFPLFKSVMRKMGLSGVDFYEDAAERTRLQIRSTKAGLVMPVMNEALNRVWRKTAGSAQSMRTASKSIVELLARK